MTTPCEWNFGWRHFFFFFFATCCFCVHMQGSNRPGWRARVLGALRPHVPGAQEKDLAWFATNDQADKVLVPSITRADFEASLHRARPTVSQDDLELYEKFTSEFGEEGV